MRKYQNAGGGHTRKDLLRIPLVALQTNVAVGKEFALRLPLRAAK